MVITHVDTEKWTRTRGGRDEAGGRYFRDGEFPKSRVRKREMMIHNHFIIEMEKEKKKRELWYFFPSLSPLSFPQVVGPFRGMLRNK